MEKTIEESLRHIRPGQMEALIDDMDIKYGPPEPGRDHVIEVLAHGLVLVHVDTDGQNSSAVQLYLDTSSPFIARHNMYPVRNSTWQVRALEPGELNIIRAQGARQWFTGPGGSSNFHQGHPLSIEVVREWASLQLAPI